MRWRLKLLLIAAAVLIVLSAYTFWPRHVAETGKFEHLPPAPEVRTVEKIIERPKIVYVYPPESKAKLNLPPAVIQDSAKKLITTGKLQAEERPYTLSAVLDTSTGETEVFARPDPLPWVAPGRRGAVGIAYGAGDSGLSMKIYAYRDMLQVKALHAGVRAEADQRGEWWAGGYVEYRF